MKSLRRRMLLSLILLCLFNADVLLGFGAAAAVPRKLGRVKITATDQGSRTTSSSGASADNEAAQNTELVIFDGKRHIGGRRFDDKENEKDPNKGIDPDEAVAHVAAVQRRIGILSGEIDEEDRGPLWHMPPSRSLGTETVGGVMTVIVPGETLFPVKKSQTFTTYQDSQSTVTIKVYEGDMKLTKDCRELRRFNLSGIAAAPRGTPQIEVTFEADGNGMVRVTAEDKATKRSQSITIANGGQLTQEEIDSVLKQAEEFAKEENARNKLKTFIHNKKSSISDEDKLSNKIEESAKEKIESALKEILEWLRNNRSAKTEDYEEKLKDLEELCNPITRQGQQ